MLLLVSLDDAIIGRLLTDERSDLCQQRGGDKIRLHVAGGWFARRQLLLSECGLPFDKCLATFAQLRSNLFSLAQDRADVVDIRRRCSHRDTGVTTRHDRSATESLPVFL